MAKPEIATERTRLAIPWDDRERAMRAAGRLADGSNALDYVREEKVWYAQPGANLTRLKEWIYDPNKTPTAAPVMDLPKLEEEFNHWLEMQGAILTEPAKLDGVKVYVDTEGSRLGSKKAAYQGFLDGRPAGWFRNYKTDDEPRKWVSSGQKIEPERLAQMRAEAAAQREVREAQRQQSHNEVAARLLDEYNRLPDATGEVAYLRDKQVTAADGVKVDERGNAVIPLYNADNEFRTLERIWTDGTKHLEKGGQAWGSFFVVGGQLQDGDDLLYAEGYATAASISEAVNKPVIMTVNAGNMVEVAGHLKEAFPASQHYFLADNDIYSDENAGLEKATEAAELTGGHVLTPVFREPRKGLTDYNDLHVSEGLHHVREQIENSINQINRVESMPSVTPQDDQAVPETEQGLNPADSMPAAEPAPAAPVASATAAAESAPAAPVASATAAAESAPAAPVASAPAAAEPAPAAPVASESAAAESAPAAPVASATAAAEPAPTAPVASESAAAEPAPAAPVASE
ncbi:toprim domain-containing protein, partial [Pantoea sp. PNA 03-3]|uniref:toprim domain-containing protein n=1 Tax=Pantoea sp. PNA 03-3 TaxID=2135460 RepID=UPI000D88168B